jgi:hypothetical protein
MCPRIFHPFECQRAFGYVVLALAVGMAIGGMINAAVRRRGASRRAGKATSMATAAPKR